MFTHQTHQPLKIGRIPLALLTLAGISLPLAQQVGAATLVDFNTPGDLTNYFSFSQENPIQQSANGGLGNSGSVNLSTLSGTLTQFWTFNQSFAGSRSSWSVSLFYNNASNNTTADGSNLWEMGIVSQPAPQQQGGNAISGTPDDFLPAIFVEAGSLDGGSIGIGSLDNNSLDYGNSLTEMSDNFAFGWYKYELNVSYLGLNQFETSATITKANADGTLGAVLATTPATTFTNASLANDPSVYLYFAVYDGGAIDNFYTTVPETSTAALGAVALLIGLRRKRA